MLAESTSVADASADLAELGVSVSDEVNEDALSSEDVLVVDIEDGASVASKVEELAALDEVVYAQPNYLYTLEDTSSYDDVTTNDPVFSAAQSKWWHLKSANVLAAWNIAKVGKTVRVAVIDTGVLATHEDLADNLDLSCAYNTTTGERGSSYVADTLGHGTHVAGIIAATANNGLGVAGVSYNAEIIPIKAVWESGENAGMSTTADMLKGLEYVMSLGDVQVVNISLGSYENDRLLGAMVSAADTRGIVVVGAGGNSGNTDQGEMNIYPADYPTVISVTWYSSSGTIDYRSDHNSEKDIAAPGTSIYSTLYSSTSNYGTMSGSSMAAPVISGICALVLSVNSSLEPADVRNVLYNTADDAGATGWDEYYGWGKVNALAAVIEALGCETTESDEIVATELSGSNRVKTSIAIAKETYLDGPSGIILVRSDTFPDALSAASLAGVLGYPIIMSSSSSLSSAVASYLRETPSISNVIIIGDENSLSASVKARVESIVGSCERIGGKNRYETAALIRAELSSLGVQSTTAVIARGDAFPDALSISPYCAASGAPLFLIKNGAAASASMVKELSAYERVVIVGSSASVSADVESALEKAGVEVVRLAGGVNNSYADNRYGTSAAIADWLVSDEPGYYSFS